MKKVLSVLVVAGFVVGASGLTAAPPGAATETWTHCASNGTTCDLNGPNTVRFGWEGNWATKDFKGNAPCGQAFFAEGSTIEGDPFGNGKNEVDKVCEVMD